MALPLIPIALGVGAYYWWKKKHPATVPAPNYVASNGQSIVAPFEIEANMPGNVAIAVVKDVMEVTDYTALSADQAWLAASGYPVSAKLVGDKMLRIQAAAAQGH